MYLFTRATRLAPAHMVDGIEWAVGVTEKVNQVTSLNVGLWASTLSPAVGALGWGCAVEHLSDLEDAEAKLMADTMYLDAVQRGATITNGQLDDETAQYLVGGGDLGFNPSYVAVVRSQLSNGNIQRGIAAGIEIAQKAQELGGLPTAFLVSSTGAYGGVGWITSARTLQELQDGENAANMNPDFMNLVDGSAECFLPGVTTQVIFRRIV
jgi:hypothetical protein